MMEVLLSAVEGPRAGEIGTRRSDSGPCRRANNQGGSDARSSFGDFCDRDSFNRAGGGADVRSGVSGLPARVQSDGEQLVRLQLHDAASVQRIGVGPLRHVRDQSILCRRRGPRGSSTASPRLLKNECIGRAPVLADRGWKRAFDEPIPLPRGRELVTLEHLDKWIAAQNDPAIDRMEAIRRLVELGLKARKPLIYGIPSHRAEIGPPEIRRTL